MSNTTKIYKLSRSDWNDEFELHISKTAKTMRNHIIKVAKDKWGIIYKGDEFYDTLGMVHPIVSTDNLFAYCFLNEENLGAGIVAHECGHLAMAHERFVLRFGMDYGKDCNEDEERMLHYMTSCIKGVYDILYKNKHIKGGKK